MNTADLPQLRDQIIRSFDLDELKDLCFRLNIQYDDIPGNKLSAKARELIEFCVRHGRLSQLIETCQKLRPHVDWPVFATETATTYSATFPSILKDANFESKIQLVQERVEQLHLEFVEQEGVVIPLNSLFSELRTLFNRNTFLEPFEECLDQNWHDRLCGAVQTDYFLLGSWAYVKDGAQRESKPHLLQSYETVQRQLRNYCQAMTQLFTKSFTVADVNRHFLENKTEQIREALNQARKLKETDLSEEVLDKCEKPRQKIANEVQSWPIV